VCVVQQSGTAIAHASNELLNNRNLVCQAVEQNGFALSLIPEHFKSDPFIVLKAVANRRHALQFASADLKLDGAMRKAIHDMITQRFTVDMDTFVSTFLFGSHHHNRKLLLVNSLHSAVVTEQEEASSGNEECLVCGRSSSASSPPRKKSIPLRSDSCLQKLNSHGKYHAIKFKKMIFEFCGVRCCKMWDTIMTVNERLVLEMEVGVLP
jgi:hypothetical protein